MSPRLGSQIAGFLFLLFSTSLLMGAFLNMSVVTDAVRSEAEKGAQDTARRVVAYFEEAARRHPDARTFKAVVDREKPWLDGRVAEFAREYPDLRVATLYDQELRVLFDFTLLASRPDPSLEELGRTIKEVRTSSQLWNYPDTSGRGGRPLESVGLLSRGEFTLEQYTPIQLPEDRNRAVLHVSVQLPFLPRQLRVIAMGNALLALLSLITGLVAINIWGEHAISRPIRNLLTAHERLGRGDYTAHVDLDVPATTELAALSNSFNRMTRALGAYQEELWDKTRRLEQLNSRYRELNEHLEQQVEEKTRDLREFFSLVTHDLRIPLAAIGGYTELLGRGDLTERQRKFLHSISVANAHSLEMVRNLLDAFRFDAGQVQMVIEPFDLPELVGEVVSHLSSVEGGEPGFVVDIQAGCERVEADRHRIGRVLTNLLSNAVRFSPPDRPAQLRVRPHGEEVEIEVQDLGPGIPEEHLPLLFKKFTQFPSKDGPSSGIGLGLYIVGRILEGHGRPIHVESTRGEGTRFWFRLPRHANGGG